MTSKTTFVARRPLAFALFAAMLAPGIALAQSTDADKQAQLAARIDQLQAELDQLKAAQAAASVPAPAPAPTTSGSAFSYGGFIKLDAMVTDTSAGEIADGSAGRMFYLPSAIPVGADAHTDPYTDMSAQFSRIWFGADKTTDAGDKLKAYVEMDFYGGGNTALAGNENATNTYAVTLRQAYVSWNDWLAGQTWSNFQDVAALPDAVDFLGPTDGTVFVRQAQVRYTFGGFSASLENPITRYETTANAAIASSNASELPDLTLRWQTKGTWGHFSVAGLLRELKDHTATVDAKKTVGAASVAGSFNLGERDDVRYMLTGGDFGRYVGLGALRGDAVLDTGGDLNAISGISCFVAWRHLWTPTLRSNLYYSQAQYDNKRDIPGYVAGTSDAVTKKSDAIHANLIYSPIPKLDVGVELTSAKRELENGADGDLRRVQTSVKYTF